ncbi:MAG: lipopolysaccharide biosynthesis [Pseudomonadota bacterium]
MNTLIRFYSYMILRRAPLLVSIVVLFSALAVGYAANQPNTYRAAARLLVEPPQIPTELALSTVNTVVSEELGLLRQRLTTRANLIDVANKLNVFPPDEDGTRKTPNEVVRAMRGGLTVTASARRGQAAIVDIRFESGDPNIAAAVVNEMVTRALDDNVRMRTESATQTLDFFEQEVNRLTNELSLQSSKITEFKSKNSNSLPEALNFRLSSEATLKERLANLEREKISLEEQRARVIAVFEETGQLSRSDTIETPEQRQLRELENELSAALAIYSETNPRVTVLRTRVEQLQRVVSGQAPVQSAPEPGSSLLNVTLAEIDSNISSLDAETARLEEDLVVLREQIQQTPQTAIGLETLQRDYSNLQRQYDAAVAGMARAKTGEQIELSANGQRISVAENAVPPSSPSSPNRKMITMAGGVAGVAVAAGLFALLELINSSIRRPGELVNRLGITPFATIPEIRTRREHRQRTLMKIALVLLVLVVLPAALYFVDQYVVSLGEIVSQIRRFL